MAIEAVIFDLGGVLIDWNPRYLYRKLFADDAQMEWFLTEVCSADWNALHDAGQPFDIGIAERIRHYPEFAPYIRCYFDRWPEMLGEHISGTLAWLERVKHCECPVYALTNWSFETFPVAARRFPFLAEFDDIIVSGRVKLAKPDRAIFELARTRFGLEPRTTLFIDDSVANVHSAARAGFQTHHFDRPEGLARPLAFAG